MWKRREIENYICAPEVLLSYAEAEAAGATPGPLFADPERERRRSAMDKCIHDLVPPIALRNNDDPWWHDVKASDEFLDRLFYLVGEAVVLLALFVLLLSIFVALLILYSFKTGNFFAARIMLLGTTLLESVIKSLFWIAGADDAVVDDVGVRLRNYINRREFLKTSREQRFIFMPQCVRSTECPAKLTPEGIKCVNCGRCNVGEAKRYAESLGYSFFIVPGSSFIKRIIKNIVHGLSSESAVQWR